QKWGSETNLDPREAGPNSRPLAFRRSDEGIPHDQQRRLGGWPLDERARFRRLDGRGNRVPLFDATGPNRHLVWLRPGARIAPALRRAVLPANEVAWAVSQGAPRAAGRRASGPRGSDRLPHRQGGSEPGNRLHGPRRHYV